MAERVDPENVVFLSADSLMRERRDEAIKNTPPNTSADRLIERIEEAEAEVRNGEWRQIVGQQKTDEFGGVGPVYAEERVVWIDDAEDDPEDPAGHFEVYDPDEHGEQYHPVPSRSGRPSEAVEK